MNRSATAPSIAVPKPGAGGATDPRVRILVLSVSSDASAQYVPMMNSIFAAQKKVRARSGPLGYALAER